MSRPLSRRGIGALVIAALVASLCAATGIRAQAPSFTLADAAVMARTNHPLLVAASGRRQMMTGMARQEAVLPNPTFEWRKENYGSPLPRDEFVSVGMPVDVYGRRLALRTVRGLVAGRASADSATTASDVQYDVARAYWRTALAHALADAAAVERMAVDTIARIETERAQQGQVSNGAALRARLEADRVRLALAEARAELARARGDLARALAIPFDSVPRPTEPLQIDSSAAALPSLDALLVQARAGRSELLSAQSRVDEMSRRQRAERLGTLPAVGMQVGNKRTSGFLTNTVQVGVAVPLFDRNGGNRERARGELLVAEGELRAARSSVDAQVQSAYHAYRVLLDEYAGRGDTTSGGAEGLRTLDARGGTVAAIAGAAYREGAITVLELLDAQRARSDVRGAAYRAAASVQMARVDLLRALGLPVDGTRFQLATQ
ncbi:MAG TPA: TolC family protein [Gemmatimonadaceae bacterium]|nr:TolC family protein [Gemmatimonadaceae bacterium]